MKHFAFFIDSFPNTLEATVTILLSFQRASVTFNFQLTTASYAPLDYFFILPTELKG